MLVGCLLLHGQRLTKDLYLKIMSEELNDRRDGCSIRAARGESRLVPKQARDVGDESRVIVNLADDIEITGVSLNIETYGAHEHWVVIAKRR